MRVTFDPSASIGVHRRFLFALFAVSAYYRTSGDPTMLLRRLENDPAISFTPAL